MKKTLFIIPIVLFAALTSCSNDSDDILEEKTVQEYDYTIEDFLKQDSINFIDWESSSESSSLKPKHTTRATITEFTIYGYASKVSSGNQKVFLDKKLANLMHLYQQIYILEYVTAYHDLHIAGIGSTVFFSAVDSPLCGIDLNAPREDLYRRGYSNSAPDANNTMRLGSKFIHVISDVGGRKYDKWYPCKPEEAQWNYKIVNI